MKITQITFTSRMGLPAYSHEEIVAVAMIPDGSDMQAEMANVKAMVNSVLYGTAAPVIAATKTVVENKQVIVDKAPVTLQSDTPSVPETAPAPKEEKAKRTRKSTVEEKADGTVTGQIGEEPEAVLNLPKKEAPAAAPKNVEKYDRSIKEHTSTFAGHLTKAYGDTWKSKDGLKAFSESLNGLEFRDTQSGTLVPAFLAKIEAFFGDAGSVL